MSSAFAYAEGSEQKLEPHVRLAIEQAAHAVVDQLPDDTPDRLRDLVWWVDEGNREALAMSGAGPEDAAIIANRALGRDPSVPFDPDELAFFLHALKFAARMKLVSWWELDA